jgi:hypothetical protein
LGGFTYINRVSLTTLQPASSAFFGLIAQLTALAGTATLSALVNCVGIGFTNGTHTNWQLAHNDGSGSATLVDMGAGFPVANTDNVYTIIVRAAPNASSIWVEVLNENTGDRFTQEITTNIPLATTFLSVRNYLNNGGAAAAVAYDCSGVYLETDY